VKIKLDNDAALYIGGKSCFDVAEVEDNDKTKQNIMHYINRGYDIKIYKNGSYVKPETYYSEDGSEDVKEDDNEEVIEEVEFEPTNEYFNLFDDHWKKRVPNVKEYTSDVEEVKDIIEYAKEKDETNKVIEGLEEYLKELEG